MSSNPQSRRRRWTLFAAVVVLAPSLYGFAGKFYELVRVYEGDPSGAFAVTPLCNYLLASLGFLCLMGWATVGGMFRDVEGPKQTMLDNEAVLDAIENRRPTSLGSC